MAALGLGIGRAAGAGPGVDLGGLLDDEAILHQLPDVLAWGAQGRSGVRDGPNALVVVATPL